MNQCYLPFLLIANNFICCEDHIDMCVRVLKAGTIYSSPYLDLFSKNLI